MSRPGHPGLASTIGQFRKDRRGPQVGEEIAFLAQARIAPLGTLVARQRSYWGPPTAPKSPRRTLHENRGAWGSGSAVRVCQAAERRFLGLDTQNDLGVLAKQNAQRFTQDPGPMTSPRPSGQFSMRHPRRRVGGSIRHERSRVTARFSSPRKLLISPEWRSVRPISSHPLRSDSLREESMAKCIACPPGVVTVCAARSIARR